MKLKDFEKVESTNIDFKESLEYSKPKSWLKTVSAFANTNGGILLFGIRDRDLEPIGLSCVTKDSEKASELINEKITPLPRYELTTFSENNKDFMAIKVGDGPKTPYYYSSDGRKEAFIRSGNTSIPAPKHILENLILKGQNTTFDELSSKYQLKDVSFTLLNATLMKETNKGIDENKDYLSLELMDSNGYITNAGLLLSDQGLLTQSRIFCTRWKGLTKGSLMTDALDDKEYTGSIISLLQNAEMFIKNNSKVSWKIEGMKRIEKEEYPFIAIREAIVNAIIHRDYQIVGSEIHIDMYDDRVEITSPGGMIDGSFIQDLDIAKISSMRRNKIISDIFNRLDFMERRGSGLVRIMGSYQNYHVKPIFYSTTSTFKVTLPNCNYIENKEKTENLEGVSKISINDTDYFLLKMYRALPETTPRNTMNQINKIFDIFGYNQSFNRENIEYVLNVKKTRANDIVRLMLQSDLIETKENQSYQFKK